MDFFKFQKEILITDIDFQLMQNVSSARFKTCAIPHK